MVVLTARYPLASTATRKGLPSATARAAVSSAAMCASAAALLLPHPWRRTALTTTSGSACAWCAAVNAIKPPMSTRLRKANGFIAPKRNASTCALNATYPGKDDDEPPWQGNQPVSAPARRESSRLVSMGPGSARARAQRGQADPAFDRLFGVSLVPCDGARVVRGRGHRGTDEPAVRQYQGRPRGTTRS